MKKIIILMILCILSGCVSSDDYNVVINKIELQSLTEDINNDYEILSMNDSLIINILDTYNNPFLFETKSIVTIDDNKDIYSFNKNKRVTDFINYKNDNYYFNLISDDEYYYIELCKYNVDQEEILMKYIIDNPTDYPSFIQYKDKYYYKINNILYDLDNYEQGIKIDDNFFFSKDNGVNNEVYIKITSTNGYTLCLVDDQKVSKLPIEMNFGNFIVFDNKLIYENLDNEYIYYYDMLTNETECLLENKINDFGLLEDNIVVVDTDKELKYIDINSKKIVCNVGKDKHSINDTLIWIYPDHKKSVSLINKDYIYVITLSK